MSKSRRYLVSLLLIGLIGLVAGLGTYPAFSSSATNPGDSFSAGTVTISDNDAGGALLSLSGAVPGDSDSGCIRVLYSGSLSSTVRVYGSSSGPLAPYLTLTVTRGADPAPSFPSCSGFTPDATNYIGAGPGVIYSGPLTSFPGSAATGIQDPVAASPETWTTSEDHVYRFSVTLINDPAARNKSGSATFTWQSRNQ
jgi:hypothetical protein